MRFLGRARARPRWGREGEQRPGPATAAEPRCHSHVDGLLPPSSVVRPLSSRLGHAVYEEERAPQYCRQRHGRAAATAATPTPPPHRACRPSCPLNWRGQRRGIGCAALSPPRYDRIGMQNTLAGGRACACACCSEGARERGLPKAHARRRVAAGQVASGGGGLTACFWEAA